MLLFVDLPGTEQIPDFISDAACQVAEAGRLVFVALDIPEQEQSRLDEFLHSGGTDKDRQRLLEGEFWRRPQQDGRSSKAVLQLIDDLRQMISRSYRVSAFGYDASLAQGTDRNAAIAGNIEAVRERAPDAVFLVLAGNARIRGDKGEAGASIATHLRGKERGLTALAMAFDGGTAWTCEGPTPQQIQCGPHLIPRPASAPISGAGAAHARFVFRWPRPAPDGLQGTYDVGPVSASPPVFDQLGPTSRGEHK
jgi:hypothetical protein